MVRHQSFIANTYVFLLQNNTVMCQAVEILAIKTTSIQNNYSSGIYCVFRILPVFNIAEIGLLLKDLNDPD